MNWFSGMKPTLCLLGLRDWNNRSVWVILLADRETASCTIGNAFKVISLKTRNFRCDRNKAHFRTA